MKKEKEKILLAHGSGGKLMHDLIKEFFLESFFNPALAALDDAASIKVSSERLAFTTDTYVVKPLFFKGGDIGRLAVCGTVNDLAMKGARPLYLSAAFVIEEGFPCSDLKKIIDSMVKASQEAKVEIVTGDTKVVERGSADALFINTAGVGVIPEGVEISAQRAQPGDVVIISGSIGDHGIAVLSEREGLSFETQIESDVAPLNGLVEALLEVTREVHVLRDPTRGGLATTLNEIAEASKVSLEIDEAAVPVKEEVLGACEMLGFDPFQVANEGKMVVILAEKWAEKALEALRQHPYGREAAIIGKVKEKPEGKVILKTEIGTNRLLDMLMGEQLPRIC